jgi:hypothetical membrane protein
MNDRGSFWLGAAGILLLLAGVGALMGIITAEALYPGYSTAENMISDLGGTEPPDSIVLQPSATIFDITMTGVGVLVIAGALSLHAAVRRRVITIPMGLLGIGVMGVGLFPGDTGTPHDLFAQLAFIAGAVTAILACRVTTPPFRYLSLVLGIVSLSTLLLCLILGESHPMADLGEGGVERWVAYPIVLWLIATGGYLLGPGPGRRSTV